MTSVTEELEMQFIVTVLRSSSRMNLVCYLETQSQEMNGRVSLE